MSETVKGIESVGDGSMPKSACGWWLYRGMSVGRGGVGTGRGGEMVTGWREMFVVVTDGRLDVRPGPIVIDRTIEGRRSREAYAASRALCSLLDVGPDCELRFEFEPESELRLGLEDRSRNEYPESEEMP